MYGCRTELLRRPGDRRSEPVTLEILSKQASTKYEQFVRRGVHEVRPLDKNHTLAESGAGRAFVRLTILSILVPFRMMISRS